MNCSLYVVRRGASAAALFCFAFFVSLASIPPANAAPLDASVCAKLAQGKAYKEASSCFLRIAKTMNKPKLSPVERKLKGLYLTNAAKLMQRTAKQQKKAHLKAYYNEQAAAMYTDYLKQRLCSQKYRCQEIRGKLYVLTKAINYAQLTIVVTGGAKGKLSFQGFKYEKEKTFPPNISQKLRPGKYRLIVQFDDKRTKIMNVELAPGKNKILTLKGAEKPKVRERVTPPVTPKPKASAPVWAYVVLGVAGAALVGAGVAAGFGFASANDASTIREKFAVFSKDKALTSPEVDAKRISDEHNDILGAHEDAQTRFTIAWILGGVAAAAAAVGIIGLVLSKPKPPPADADAALPSGSKNTRLARELFTF